MGRAAADLTGDQIAGDDADGPAVLDDQVEHLGAGVHLDRAGLHLMHQRLVGAEQQLLARLAPGVERAGHLRTTEGPVVEQSAVLAGEGHALGDRLVDDVDGQFGEPVDVGLAAAVVATLDRVVEQTPRRVAVVLVVLRSVDAALGRDAVRPAR